VPLSRNLGTLTSRNPLDHPRPVTGLLYLYLIEVGFQLVDWMLLAGKRERWRIILNMLLKFRVLKLQGILWQVEALLTSKKRSILLHGVVGPIAQSVKRLTAGWTVRGSNPVGARFSAVQTDHGAHPASCTMGTGSFPGVKCGWGVLLTTHPF
jgi:hypothetical protein